MDGPRVLHASNVPDMNMYVAGMARDMGVRVRVRVRVHVHAIGSFYA